MSNQRSFERSLGAGKGVETVSRSVSEESTYAKKKEFSLRKEMHFNKIYIKPFAQFRRQ